MTHETGDVRQVIERLRWLADRIYAQKAELWPTPERPYVVKHDRANCDDPEHVGCAYVGMVETARRAADMLTAHPAPSGWQPIDIVNLQEVAGQPMFGFEKSEKVPHVMRWVGVGWSSIPGGYSCHPTHVMPLPPGPGQTAVDALPPAPEVKDTPGPEGATAKPVHRRGHLNTCDLVGFRQGYNAPGVCSCGFDASPVKEEPQ